MLARIFQDHSEIIDSTGKNKQLKEAAEAAKLEGAEGSLEELTEDAVADADSEVENEPVLKEEIPEVTEVVTVADDAVMEDATPVVEEKKE